MNSAKNARLAAPMLLSVALEPTVLANALAEALGHDEALKLAGQVRYRLKKGSKARKDLPGQLVLFADWVGETSKS